MPNSINNFLHSGEFYAQICTFSASIYDLNVFIHINENTKLTTFSFWAVFIGSDLRSQFLHSVRTVALCSSLKWLTDRRHWSKGTWSISNFKVVIINILILTMHDDHLYVKGLSHSDELRELPSKSAVLLSSAELFNVFQLIVLILWPTTLLISVLITVAFTATLIFCVLNQWLQGALPPMLPAISDPTSLHTTRCYPQNIFFSWCSHIPRSQALN